MWNWLRSEAMRRLLTLLSVLTAGALLLGQGAPPQPKYFHAVDYPNDSGGKILLVWGSSNADNLSDFKIDKVFNEEFKQVLPRLRAQASEALKNASGPAADYLFTRLLTIARKNFRNSIAEKMRQKEKKPPLTYIIEYSTAGSQQRLKLAEVASNANLQGTNTVLFGNYPRDPYGHFLVVDVTEQICKKEKEAYEKGVLATATREQMALERFEQRAESRLQALHNATDKLALLASLRFFHTHLQKKSATEEHAKDLLWLCEKVLKEFGVPEKAKIFDMKLEGKGVGIRLLRAAWNKALSDVVGGAYFRRNWYPLTEQVTAAVLQIRQDITKQRDLAASNYDALSERLKNLMERRKALEAINAAALKEPAISDALRTLKQEIEKERQELGDKSSVDRRLAEFKQQERKAQDDLARFARVVSSFINAYKGFLHDLGERAQQIFGKVPPPNAEALFAAASDDWERFVKRLSSYSGVCHLLDRQIVERLSPWFEEANLPLKVEFTVPQGTESAYTTTLKSLTNEVITLERQSGLGVMDGFKKRLLSEAAFWAGPFGHWGSKNATGVGGSLYFMALALEKMAENEADKAAVFRRASSILSKLWDDYCDALRLVKLKRRKVFEETTRQPITFYLSMRQGEGDAAKTYSVAEVKAQALPNLFHTGKTTTLVIALLACGLVYLFIRLARGGKELFIRKIPGLDAVDEAVGRATEMGRPVYFITGLGSMDALPVIAAINILGRIARKTAEHDTRLRMPCYDPIVMSVAQEVVKEAATAVGRPDTFRKDDIFFVAQEQFAYAAAVDGMFVREKPATIFYMGMFYAESLLLAETGATVGAIQIAGTDSYSQLPFFITACDYTLIGEELYAASAYLSREPVLLGSLRGQDTMKGLIIIAILVGFILALFGVDIIRLLFVEG